jgi:hypothetical protein
LPPFVNQVPLETDPVFEPDSVIVTDEEPVDPIDPEFNPLVEEEDSVDN